MGRASDVLAAGSADNRAVPKTPASWLLSADQSQTDAPLPGGAAPQSEPHDEPDDSVPRASALGRCRLRAKGHVLTEFYSGATGRSGRLSQLSSEGFSLRRFHVRKSRSNLGAV